MSGGTLLVILAGLGFGWAVLTYNALVRLKLQCSEAWSNVETELKRRHDLIPNLVETVRAHARHEREVLERVVQARREALSTARPGERGRREGELARALRGLLAVAEGYPRLRSSEGFLKLQRELVNTEDRIQAARRFYNANVRELNTRLQVFPSSLIGRWFSIAPEEYFQAEEAVHAVPEVEA